MDLSYIKKLANFKQTCSDANELREKVSREHGKLIKLRVDQSTAYFKLNEKYEQLQLNYENLQQNMLQAQMQHEKISEDYMKEKRHRHEILNKVSSTREICDQLIKYTSKLEESVTRSKADQSALNDGYNKANEIIKDVKLNHRLITEKLQNEICNLNEKVIILNESRAQIMQYYEESKLEAQTRVAQMESNVNIIKQRNDELHKENAAFHSKLQANNIVIQQKEKMISSLESDMQHIITELDKHSKEMNTTLREHKTTNENLVKKIAEQEELAKKITNENEEYKETIAQLNKIVEDLKQDNVKYEELAEDQRRDGEVLREKLIQEIKQWEELLETKSKEMEERVKENSDLKLENDNKEKIIKEMKEECELQLKVVCEKEEALIAAHKEIINLNEQIKDNDIKMNDILNDWKKAKDESCNLNMIIKKQDDELNEEKNKYSELELKHNVYVEHTEQFTVERNKAAAIDKDNILELTKEKKILEGKVKDLQKIIDDMRMENEVTSLKSVLQQDDNAVMACPPPVESDTYVTLTAKKDVYNFPSIFSDSSEDNASLNLSEVNRIFVGKCARPTMPMKRKQPQMASQASYFDKEAQKGKAKIFKTKPVNSRKN